MHKLLFHLTRSTLLASACVFSFIGTAQRADAVDAQPRDYATVPAGTKVALFYYSHGSNNNYVDSSGSDIPKSELTTNVMVARYVEYFEFDGHLMNWNVLQVFGGFDSPAVGGTELSDDGFQLGDTVLVFTLYPVTKPDNELTVAIANHLVLPTGSNDSDIDVNLGGNRWSVIVQPGFYATLSSKWSFELIGDISIYGNNSNGPGGATVEEDPSVTVLTWLTYAAPRPGSYAAVGVTATKFGTKNIGGVSQGDGHSIAIRAAYTHKFSPTIQLVTEISHDVSNKNTFEKDIGVLFRLGKAF